MKKLKHYLLRKENALLSAVLALVGCNGVSDDENEPDYYGCPYVNYHVEGAVLDDKGNPLEGILIIPKAIIPESHGEHVGEAYPMDTLATASDGSYLWEEDHGWGSDSIRVVAEDPSGKFASDSVDVRLQLNQRKKKSDNYWYMGTLEGEVNLTLKPKAKE
jgi:putative lipoprotein (rSAM/lipoprotein system)